MTKNVPTEDLWRVVENNGAFIVQGWDGNAYQNMWIGPEAAAHDLANSMLDAEKRSARLAKTERHAD